MCGDCYIRCSALQPCQGKAVAPCIEETVLVRLQRRLLRVRRCNARIWKPVHTSIRLSFGKRETQPRRRPSLLERRAQVPYAARGLLCKGNCLHLARQVQWLTTAQRVTLQASPSSFYGRVPARVESTSRSTDAFLLRLAVHNATPRGLAGRVLTYRRRCKSCCEYFMDCSPPTRHKRELSSRGPRCVACESVGHVQSGWIAMQRTEN